MPRQFFAALSAAEHRIGQAGRQLRTLRPVTDDDQFQLTLWISATQSVQAALEHPQVFFLGQAAHVQHRAMQFFGAGLDGGDQFQVILDAFQRRHEQIEATFPRFGA